MKGGIITIILLMSLIVVITPVNAANWHVYPGPGTPIQTAITNANPGDTIYVHAGTYNENLTIAKNLSLIGDGAAVTIIDGGTADVIDVNGVVVNISGFTVRNGRYGIYYHNNASGTIMNNTITGNTMDGIYNNSSSPTITNNTITGSQQGIFNDSSSNPTITNNTITGNWYGIYNKSSSNPTITNNTITGNTADGICNVSSSPTITNNTITGNAWDGIANWSSSNPTITNNIVVSNGINGIYDDGTGAPVCTYNDVWGNGADYFNVTPGVGSISQDPLLDGTYHLTSSSPCIDAGTDAGVYTDMDGDSRPQGSGFDIGADEYYISQVFVNPIAAFIPVKNYHLREVNAYLECITENLPEDVSQDVQELLDDLQEHIDNANTTGNTIYANNELLKALKCCEDIQEKLGITCP